MNTSWAQSQCSSNNPLHLWLAPVIHRKLKANGPKESYLPPKASRASGTPITKNYRHPMSLWWLKLLMNCKLAVPSALLETSVDLWRSYFVSSSNYAQYCNLKGELWRTMVNFRASDFFSFHCTWPCQWYTADHHSSLFARSPWQFYQDYRTQRPTQIAMCWSRKPVIRWGCDRNLPRARFQTGATNLRNPCLRQILDLDQARTHPQNRWQLHELVLPELHWYTCEQSKTSRRLSGSLNTWSL
jgi:hypothetical protein